MVEDENDGSFFKVVYENTSLKMRLSQMTRKFEQVQDIAAKNVGLERGEKVFLMDAQDDGCIFLKNMDVKRALFPMETAK